MTEKSEQIKASFGKWLQEERTAHKITLEELSARTSIRTVVLRAIEAEAHDQLPAEAYTVGFLRLFAREVGLDPDEVVRRYYVHRDSEADEKKRPNWSRTYETYTDSSRHFRWLFVLLVGVVLVVAAWWSYSWLWPQLSELISSKWQIGSVQSEGDKSESANDAAPSKPVQPEGDKLAVEEKSNPEPSESIAPEVDPKPADDTVVESESNQPSGTVEGEAAEPANNEAVIDRSDTNDQKVAEAGTIDTSSGFQLKIAALATTWLRVTPEGDLPKEYTLQQGDQKEFEIPSGVMLLIGNAGGITLTVNGQPYPIEGEKGDVVRMSIP